MVKRAVQYGLKHRVRPPVPAMGIDEVSRRKGQVYLTVVYDLERRVLLWVGDGRTEEEVKPFFTKDRAPDGAIACASSAWTCGHPTPIWCESTRAPGADPV
jgi:hypothetical protein